MSRKQTTFPDVYADMKIAAGVKKTPQTTAPSYRLAFRDEDFLCKDELRAMRMYLEMLKPEMELAARGIESTVVLFGGAKVLPPEQTAQTDGQKRMAVYYEQAREFARRITQQSDGRRNVIVTGGGPGVMEAGNRGAAEASGHSIALNIVLPFEHAPNIYCTPDLCFNFHYFATRKYHFLLRAKMIAVFPGGFGTLDELFETLTLVQTQKMNPVPIVLFGKAFWRACINFDALIDAGTIAAKDVELFHYVETAEEAMTFLNCEL